MMLLESPERWEPVESWKQWEADLLALDQSDPSVVDELARTRRMIEFKTNPPADLAA